MKLPNGIIINLEARRGSVRMRMPFGESYSIPPLTEAQQAQLASLAARQAKSLQPGAENVDPTLTFDQVNPQEGDFIFPKFRALDAGIVSDYWLDFSGADVVKNSVPLWMGQTVYKNHIFWNVENWLGAISQSSWDESGKQVSSGKPGVNVELKIDWKSNPKIARGLLMKPPAIHSVSGTIEFDWDASHPDLLEQGIFFRNLGQEIEGSIVRIVVTAIRKVYEISLVYQGANDGSNAPIEDGDEEGLNAGGQPESLSGGKPPSQLRIAQAKETKKVKLTPERKATLGITAEGEEVDDAIVLGAVDSLAARAAAADPIVTNERAEVLRLATLVEGVGEGDARALSPELASLINGADAATLPGLRKLYQDKFDAAFPLACEQGHKATSRRSSVEQVKTAGEEQQAEPVAQAYPGF